MPERLDPKIRLMVYPGAYQGFDIPGADHMMLGHRIQHSPQAEEASVSTVKSLIGGLAP